MTVYDGSSALQRVELEAPLINIQVSCDFSNFPVTFEAFAETKWLIACLVVKKRI